MCKHIRTRTISVFVLSLVVSGCSTLEVRDAYIPVGNETKLLDYKSEDVKLRVRINPDTRFYSIGILGFPIIPTYFTTSDPTEITLAISLTLQRDQDFSFASRPCLTVENSIAFCPYKLEVSAVALYQDDGSMYADKQKRSQKISNFYRIENRILTLPIAPESSRVNRQRIYKHYGYTGVPKWDYLRVDLTYNFKCDGVCPERMELNAKDLVAVGNLPIPNGNYSFEKIRQNDYRFTTRIQ